MEKKEIAHKMGAKNKAIERRLKFSIGNKSKITTERLHGVKKMPVHPIHKGEIKEE